MLNALRKRLDRDEEGFTLIELMVVVLIIAILIAIAIPTFLGAQNRARDRGAQSDLRNAMTAAKTIAVDAEGKFQVGTTNITASDMATAEGAITFSGSASSVADAVVVVVGTGGADITLYTQSASGTYFGISSSSTGATKFCSDAAVGNVDDATACDDAKW